MSANERQVGGRHYKRDFQHWDLMALANAGYFAGQVTKYTERHSRKNGKEDLEKALHFAEKMHEVSLPDIRVPRFRRTWFGTKKPIIQPRIPVNPIVVSRVRDYAVDAGLTAIQERIFEHCLVRPDKTEEIVDLCRRHLEREYGAPEIKDPTEAPSAGIPVMIFGVEGQRLSEAQQRMAEDIYQEKYVPGTPEDGGHHEGEPGHVYIDLPVEIENQVKEDVSNIALVNALAAQRSTETIDVTGEGLKIQTPLKSRRTPPEKADPRKK